MNTSIGSFEFVDGSFLSNSKSYLFSDWKTVHSQFTPLIAYIRKSLIKDVQTTNVVFGSMVESFGFLSTILTAFVTN